MLCNAVHLHHCNFAVAESIELLESILAIFSDCSHALIKCIFASCSNLSVLSLPLIEFFLLQLILEKSTLRSLPRRFLSNKNFIAIARFGLELNDLDFLRLEGVF